MSLQSIDNDGIRTFELFVQWAVSLAWTLGTLELYKYRGHRYVMSTSNIQRSKAVEVLKGLGLRQGFFFLGVGALCSMI